MGIHRSTKVARLKAAGYVLIQGWIPAGTCAALAQRWIDDAREDVERIAATKGKAGRPPRKPKAKTKTEGQWHGDCSRD